MADSRRVVVLTARDDLRAAVLRLAALAGVDAEVVGGSVGVRTAWRATAVVLLVGADLAAAVAAAGLPRRPDVVVVATERADELLWRSTVEIGAARLVVLPDDERALVELMSDAVEAACSAGSVLAVIGGCGGAGASTLAAGLAITTARSGPTGLVDGDRYAGGLDVLLGAEQRPGARWPDLAATRGRLAAAALTDSLPRVDGVAVLSWDRAGSADLGVEAAEAVMNAATRAFASVVVDLPRRFDPVARVLIGTAAVVTLVVPATVRGTAAAATVAAELVTAVPRLQLVVRDPGAGRLNVGEVSNALGLPVVAALRSESSVTVAADRGEPPFRRPRGALHDACRDVLAAINAPG
ncbi:MAG TPA: septum site-determining protein Ssd [Mycobacteriales bacterium]|jgi:secretion/DNA translocation related CpaE-like protein|nr:septum site-determining protein Ssd [Mycobacteriales bacterium]